MPWPWRNGASRTLMCMKMRRILTSSGLVSNWHPIWLGCLTNWGYGKGLKVKPWILRILV